MSQHTREGNLGYADVLEYIRTYSTNPQNPPYDFSGVVHLMLAALDNLRRHGLDAELEDIGYCFTDEQRLFLKKIVEYACHITDADIDHETP